MPSRGIYNGSMIAMIMMIAGLVVAFGGADGAAAESIDDGGEPGTPVCCGPTDPWSMRLTGVSRTTASSTDDTVTPEADREIRRLLEAIDVQTLALRDFVSRVRMDTYDDLADETEKRFGRVYMVMPTLVAEEAPKPDPSAEVEARKHRRAAIVFERSIEPSGRARERLEHFVLDDGVLSDYDHEAKRLVRRRVVEPGDRRDPLRLGDGPVPLPIGQRSEDIVRHFDVTLAAAVPTRIAKSAEDVVGLHLVPKPGTEMAENRKIASIDLWLVGEDHLPFAVELRERDGDRTTVRFFDPVLNAGIDEAARRWLEAPEVDPKVWRIESK
ncbi:MAG: hypothetical protein CMJ27_03840 [Phycisphaerae bacterium]|nr:hypothetical protein [Phycisphaerae bacterium]